MSDLLPLDVPHEWHRFLYRSVLLEWETRLNRCEQFPRFNGRKPYAGITLKKINSLKEIGSYGSNRGGAQPLQECIVFHTSGTALKGLLGLLRNCVAHGHYSRSRYGWIRFHHKFQGKVKLSGQVKFANLKSLVALITCDANGGGQK